MPRSPPRPPRFPYTTLFRSPFAEQRLERRHGEFGRSEEDDAHLQLAGRLGRHVLEIALLSLARLLPFGDEEAALHGAQMVRSEEHTSELQSHSDLVCRLLLE